MPRLGTRPAGAPIDQIRAALERGLTRREVAEVLGVTLRLVKRRMVEAGLQANSRGSYPGARNPAWKGGRLIEKSGYVLVLAPDHPEANRHGYVREHRLVAERMLGRRLLPGERVHHREPPKSNNDPSNLVVYASNGQHLGEELKGRVPRWTEDGKLRIRAGRLRYLLRRFPSNKRALDWRQELDDLLSRGVRPKSWSRDRSTPDPS